MAWKDNAYNCSLLFLCVMKKEGTSSEKKRFTPDGKEPNGQLFKFWQKWNVSAIGENREIKEEYDDNGDERKHCPQQNTETMAMKRECF